MIPLGYGVGDIILIGWQRDLPKRKLKNKGFVYQNTAVMNLIRFTQRMEACAGEAARGSMTKLEQEDVLLRQVTEKLGKRFISNRMHQIPARLASASRKALAIGGRT